MRRLALLTIAAVVLFLIMPPAPRQLPAAPPGVSAPIRGVIHVHTNRSDGTGSVDDVTRAAAAAGLQFVIVTDHGDGTRTPDLPDYRNGVLYIDGVEVSTIDGHLVALGLPQAPYPLGGEGRDVVDDVHRPWRWDANARFARLPERRAVHRRCGGQHHRRASGRTRPAAGAVSARRGRP